MILARERSDYYHQPLQVNRPPRTQRVMRFKNRTKVLYAGILLAAFLMGLGLTWRYVQVTATGYEIVRMKKDLKALEDRNQELQMQADNMTSLPRIQSVAVNKLGMIKPDGEAGVQFVAVESSKSASGTAAAQTAAQPAGYGQTAARAAQKDDSVNIIRAFTNLVAAWTGKAAEAEAGTVK